MPGELIITNAGKSDEPPPPEGPSTEIVTIEVEWIGAGGDSSALGLGWQRWTRGLLSSRPARPPPAFSTPVHAEWPY